MVFNNLSTKVITTFILLLSFSLKGDSQNLQEWTEQRQTQLKYLMIQIARLQGYEQQLSAGYLATHGLLSTVGLLKSSDKEQHYKHFRSFLKVSEAAKRLALKNEIDKDFVSVSSSLSLIQGLIARSTPFVISNHKYLHDVLWNLRNATRQKLLDARFLLADNQFSLSDDERLKRLHEVKSDLDDLLLFVKHFETSIKIILSAEAEFAK